MTEERIREQLSLLASELDEKEYPEMAESVAFILDIDSCDPEEEMDLATDLAGCDETKPLPKAAAALLEEIYLDELKKENYAAANDLGALYYTGRIGVQDYTKAMHYYKIAADGGDRQAQENLGYCYYYGRNCEKDYEKAFHYFALGAFDGHLRSLYKIGDMYRNGYYVPKNTKEAYQIYKRCDETMTPLAEPEAGADVAMRMGDAFFEGMNGDPDYERALAYYQKAEQLFYKRLRAGDFLIRKCYERVISRQEETRKRMAESLPDFAWTK